MPTIAARRNAAAPTIASRPRCDAAASEGPSSVPRSPRYPAFVPAHRGATIARGEPAHDCRTERCGRVSKGSSEGESGIRGRLFAAAVGVGLAVPASALAGHGLELDHPYPGLLAAVASLVGVSSGGKNATLGSRRNRRDRQPAHGPRLLHAERRDLRVGRHARDRPERRRPDDRAAHRRRRGRRRAS